MSSLAMGIKSKLFCAFALVLATTLIASGIGLYSYWRLSDSLSGITEESVPLMEESMNLAKHAAEFSARIPLLAASENAEDAGSQYELIQQSLESSESLLNEKALREGRFESARDDRQSLEQRSQVIDVLYSQVLSRIRSAAKLDESVAEARQLRDETDRALADIIDTATYDFVVVVDDISERNADSLNRLLYTHVDTIVKVLQMTGSIRKLSHLLHDVVSGRSTLSITDSSAQAESLLEETTKISANLSNSSIHDMEEYRNIFSNLTEFVVGSASVFQQDKITLSPNAADLMLNKLSDMEERFIKAIAPLVENSYSMAFLAGDELTKSINEEIPEHMYDGLERLVGLLQLRAELNNLAGTISQVPQIATEKELSTLHDRFYTATKAIELSLSLSGSTGELDIINSNVSQILKLGKGENGVFINRGNEIQHKSDIQETTDQLLAIQTAEVDDLVVQVRDSRDNVALASNDVASLIFSSQLQLLAVSALGIMFTLVVFWLLVSKDILARLLQTINALRSLADGKYDVSVDSKGGDELADLARTVDVFRVQALEAQRLQSTQAQVVQQQKYVEQAQSQANAERQLREEKELRHKHEKAESERQADEARALQDRVDQLLVAVSAAADGNLNHPLVTDGDDLAGQMGKALDSLFTELRNSMRGINKNATKLTIASENLTSLSVDMNESAASNAESAHQATRLTSEVSSSVDSVAGATEQMTSSIREITRNTTEAESVAGQAVKLAESTSTTIRKLAESSAGIGSVIKVITSIAEQTNLLALNATIEAARAGDAGKGFAVVANEVKDLAKETARATEQIENRISDIQSDTESAVVAIQSIDEIISLINGIQSTITLSIDGQFNMTQEIGRSVELTSDRSEAISSVLEGMAVKALENHKTSDAVSNAAGELSEMASQLQGLVQRYGSKEVESPLPLRSAA